LFFDETFDNSLVPLLFGLIPGYMLETECDLKIELNKFSLKLL
jgi:hypothetical protein